MMLKKLIAPVQQLLLKNHQCVGCGRRLDTFEVITKNGQALVVCACGRIFVKEKESFRRALFEEV